ncbi:aminotransferase-like domain-containing protein [Micromonospora sp. NBC_00421]|uniref:aminotransferase-like domain-containing protein n=1 Tax=Micromonospora sp. NBC_00421 TaxID=2975976 RepID=UPI002E1BD80B
MWTTNAPAVEMPQLFERGGDLISFAGGLPDLSRLPLGDLAGQLSRLTRLGGRTALQYSTPHVARSLLPAINDLMAREGTTAEADELVPTGGSQLGLTAVALGLARPGEAVLCQTPAYPGALAAFRLAGLTAVGVPADAEGLDPQALRDTVLGLRAGGTTARLLYVNPTFSNPTGATLGLDRRAGILRVCRDLDLLMIEDNPYGLLSFTGEHVTACRALDPDRVVYLGTFSKIFAPGLRCGWIAAPRHLAGALRATTEVMSLSPSAFAQAALAAFYTGQGWDDLLAGYRESYRERAALMTSALEHEFGLDGDWSWGTPSGGFYVWLRHRAGADTSGFAAAAAQRGVSYVPGRHFSIDGEHADGLRLCFSYPAPAKITEGVARLAQALSGRRDLAQVAR